MTSWTDERRQTVDLDMDHLLMVLLFLWSSDLQAEGQHNSTDKLDIVLLMDDSGSISKSEFQEMKLAFKEFVKNLNMDQVQIGLVQYSDNPRTEFHLNTHQTKESLLKAINDLRHTGGGTETGTAMMFLGKALSYILHNNFKPNVGMRADSRKIIVLITDGKSTDDVVLPSENLKATGIEVYVIAVKDADETQLWTIASGKKHMFAYDDFSSLQAIGDALSIALFDSTSAFDFQCETTDKADIMLLMDDSGSISSYLFRETKLFFQKIVNTFNISQDRVQIGLVQYSDNPRTEFHLNTHQTKESLLKAINDLRQTGGGTETGKALSYILHNNFKPNVGMRADSRKIIVLITDGESTDDVVLPSENLKATGIEVYVIGVGDADKTQLKVTTSDPTEIHVYSTMNLQDIFDIFTINLCNSINSLDSVRLVNGTSLCSGRLEVKSCHFNQSCQLWSSVCEDDFDLQDAEVVCRELHCGAPSVLQGGLYGEVEPPMWTEEFQCGGNESALLDCRRSDSAEKTCSRGKAVGLTCSEPVRFVGGASRCAGTLEVKRGDWRPVYGPDWTLKTAAVVCRELDCGSAVSQALREKPQQIWEISSSCVESGYALKECVSSSQSSYMTEITCLEPVRFVGGASRCAGTLEVKRGDWRPVYGPDWTLKTAAVVCRELDCGSAVSIGIRNESSYKSTWEISSSCVESGYALRECVSPSFFSSSIEITCSDSVRLVNGTSLCSGRLEVKSCHFNQSCQLWSSVCEDDFDLQDAEVVCRELHCGAPSVLQGGLYGEVEPPMWTEEFQCGGNESALLHCRRSDSAGKTCSRGKAVGLTCSEPVRLVGGASRCAGILEVKRGDWREVRGSYWTLVSAALVCRKLDCGFAASTRIREDSSKRLTLRISSDCVQSGSALRECATLSWSSSVLELTCSDPAGFIRLVVLPLTLLLFIIVICFTHKATRGQKPGPQQNTELDYYNVGVCTVEGGSAEKEGAQATE